MSKENEEAEAVRRAKAARKIKEAEEEYEKEFHRDCGRRRKAYEIAMATRNFEIDLYWRRTAYFWTLISAIFIAYGFYESPTSDENKFIAFFLSCLGLVLSFGWVFANYGSKQWQENWEHHVDHLEDEVTGPLYKWVLRRDYPSGFGEWRQRILGTGPCWYSVSKINQIIGFYITFAWGVLVAYSLASLLRCELPWGKWVMLAWGMLAITFIAVFCIAVCGRTHTKKEEAGEGKGFEVQKHKIHRRKPRITGIETEK